MRLPRISDQQYDEIVYLARQRGYDLNQCPTCDSRMERLGGDLAWPEAPTYRYRDEIRVCDCVEQDKLRRHYMLAHIPDHYWRLGPEEYWGDPEAWRVMEAYLTTWEAYRKLGSGIEFFSPTMGTGKTFLATYIARQLVQRSEQVYFTRFREIMGLYQKPYEARKETEERLWYTRVLVLDEVCPPLSAMQGHYFASEFENLIRSRIDENRVTIMTTNLRPEELDATYQRTYGLLAAKQQRHEIHADDARRSGKVALDDLELAANGETRPIV